MVAAVDKLRALDMLDCLQLLHFHIGSQITNIRAIKDALREASRIFVELHGLGANMRYLDCGGGLGVDYDGSQTNFHSSVNYTLQEYAADIVSQVAEACNAKDVPHPDIVTESGRALVAHHSVLVFNVLATNEMLIGQIPDSVADDEHPVIQQLYETYEGISRKNFQEAYHDALQIKEEAITAFNLGFLDLKARARVEELFWATCEKILKIVRDLPYVPDELEGLEKQLSDTYYCNFSLFQSLPDHWAVRQLFPTLPIHRLNKAPSRRAVLADLTCDSDGKMDEFIDLRDVKHFLELHPPNGEPYFIGTLPRRRLPGDPGRPPQPLRRHRRRPRQARRRRLPRGARRGGRLRLRGPRPTCSTARTTSSPGCGGRWRWRCARSASPWPSPAASCGGTRKGWKATRTSPSTTERPVPPTSLESFSVPFRAADDHARHATALPCPLMAVLPILALSAPAAADELNLFAAASLTEAVKEVAGGFEKATGHTVVFNFGGSNDLARQIKAGAPADVFFSADVAQMDGLVAAGLVRAQDRVDVLSNVLVVVVPAGSGTRVGSPADLVPLRRLALADPQAVPAGVYARQWLESAGVWAKVADKVVPALNVRAALSAVEAGNVDAGIVYKTDAAVSKRVEIAFDRPQREGTSDRLPPRPDRGFEEGGDRRARRHPDVGLGARGVRPSRLPRPRGEVGPAHRVRRSASSSSP